MCRDRPSPPSEQPEYSWKVCSRPHVGWRSLLSQASGSTSCKGALCCANHPQTLRYKSRKSSSLIVVVSGTADMHSWWSLAASGTLYQHDMRSAAAAPGLV